MKTISILLLFLLQASLTPAREPALVEITFRTSEAVFPNPERGWYRARELTDPWGFDIIPEEKTLIYGRISADEFKNVPFSQKFLDAIQAGFDLARKNGIKVNPRVAYNNGPEAGCPAEYGCDAPKDVIMGHIAQLKPVWETNKDVINVVDPGFIGGWGEWHTSSNGLNNPSDEKDILFAILDAVPADRMVYIRYPALKREIFGGDKKAETPVLDSSKAFDQSNLARVGHLNDCFLSGDDDVGTYQYGWSRKKNLDYIGAESPYVPFGGETCALHTMGECENALYEMEKLHINHLNHDYHEGVIQRWKDDGCYDEITRRLGYRFVLENAMLPDSVKPGGVLTLRVSVKNTGFGELFNPRDVEIALIHNSTSQVLTAGILADPRFWSAGKVSAIQTFLSLPGDMAEGKYSVGIRLPDKSPSIRDDFRYAIRFANEGVWDAEHGANILRDDLIVSADAPGEANPAFTSFEEINGPLKTWAKRRVYPEQQNAKLFTVDGRYISDLDSKFSINELEEGIHILTAQGKGAVKVVWIASSGKRAQLAVLSRIHSNVK